MSQYFVISTNQKVTKQSAKRINRAIKEIDSTATFIGPLSIPGSTTTGWLERPNDGTNDYLDVRKRNDRMRWIVRKELGIKESCE